MRKVSKKDLKNKILSGFIKLLDSKPELHNQNFIKEAYIKLRSEIHKK